ncbi:eukaryotic translation initiation factor 2C 1, partial [Trichinella spiralis]|uniref:eukaryotic translation initiation factor 2C 1 n=1 Tax=Trichinella spiralis TaxID=6334 RepID=UPI0001EFD882
MRLVFEKLNVLSRDVEAIITVSENERYPFEVESKLLLLFYSQLVLLPMCEQSQDTNVAADEVLQLRLRPGYGTVGKPIKLACNYFPLIKLQKGDIMVNRYHIDIQHPRLNDDNRDIFWAYAVKRSDIFGDPFKLAYDGMNTLFTVDKLHLKQVSEKADT